MSVENLAGQKLGQYELRDLLGSGGMGAVYRAHQAALGRDVAVKVLPPSLAGQEEYLQRFTREARIAASLEHPHIVPVYDYGSQDGITFVVMRLLEDGTLAQRMYLRRERGAPLPSLGESAELLRQMASALDYAHRKGVVHRDIKPGNIMFDDATAYLVDFGIARLMNAAVSTGEHLVFGTPMYMPPEQWRDEELKPETDQYALGAVVYSMVTGHPPFDAQTPHSLMYKHLNEAPIPPTALRRDLPPAVADVLNRAMAKTPSERFLTATAFAQAYAAAIAGARGDSTGFFTFSIEGDHVDLSPLAVSQALPQAPPENGSAPEPEAEAEAELDAVVDDDVWQADLPESVPPWGGSTGASWVASPEDSSPLPMPPPPAAPVYTPPPASRPAPARRRSPLASLAVGGIIGIGLLALLICGGAALVVNQLGIFDVPTATADADAPTPIGYVDEENAPTTEPTPTSLPDTDATQSAPPTRVAAADVGGASVAGEGFSHGTQTVRAVDFSLDGAALLTGVGDGSLRLWNVASGAQTMVTHTSGGVVNDAAYSPDGTRTGAGTENGMVFVYDASLTTQIASWQAHNAPVRAVAFNPDGSRIATASEDMTARVWDVASRTPLLTLTGHSDRVLDVAYSPDGARLATASGDSTARIWDLASGNVLHVLRGHTGELRSVAYSPDGTRVATASADGTIRVWDTETGTQVNVLNGHIGWIWTVEFSPDGTLLLSGGRDDTARLWDAQTGDMLATLTGHAGWVIGVAFSPDMNQIATGGGDGFARLWDTSSG